MKIVVFGVCGPCQTLGVPLGTHALRESTGDYILMSFGLVFDEHSPILPTRAARTYYS